MLSVVLAAGVAGEAPNENGDLAGVAGTAEVEGAGAPKVNPPEPPEELDGKMGLGASMAGVEDAV